MGLHHSASCHPWATLVHCKHSSKDSNKSRVQLSQMQLCRCSWGKQHRQRRHAGAAANASWHIGCSKTANSAVLRCGRTVLKPKAYYIPCILVLRRHECAHQPAAALPLYTCVACRRPT